MPTTSGIHFFASGDDQRSRPPTLLIHGAGGNRLYWPPQVRRLPDQRLFAMDLPGHGDSFGLGHQRIPDYTEDVMTLMHDLRVNRAILIGHSMGGAVALDAAIRFPDRVLALGLVGTAARLRVDPAIMRSAAEAETFPASVRMLVDSSFSPTAPARLKELALARMSEMRPPVLYGDLLASDAFDCMHDIARIDVPTTILCGTDDRMTPPKYSQYMHEQIPGSMLHLIPDAGHMVMLERPDLVADELAGFLNSVEYTPGR